VIKSINIKTMLIKLIISISICYGFVPAPVTAAYCDFTVNNLDVYDPLEPLEAAVFDEVNRVREKNGAGELIRDSALDSAARQHSAEMSIEGYFEHFSPGIKQRNRRR
jgi:uncharacterized protein YkwD